MSPNPLLQKGLSFIRTWEEWLECWEKATRVSEFCALIHSALNVDPNGWGVIDHRRILFLLEVADGHAHPSDLLPTQEAEEERRRGAYEFRTEFGTCHGNGGLRALVAQKAMQVLCLKFFKPQESHGRIEKLWIEAIFRYPELLDKLVWFLRPRGKTRDLYNEPDEPKSLRSTFLIFARDFCEFVWSNPSLQNYQGLDQETAYQLLVDARPKLVGTLDRLECLDRLHGWEGADDPAVLSELRRLAFRELFLPSETRPHSEGFRIPRNLAEAVMGGSAAARVLLVLNTACRAKNWIKRSVKLHEQAREAQKELAKVTGGK